MGLRALYAIDPKANEDGVWVAYPANPDGSVPRFKLARMSAAANKRYAKSLEKHTKPYRRELELETLDEAVGDKLMLDVFCESVLLDWENVQPNEDGEALPFSHENASRFLSDPIWSELYSDLQDRAKKAALFRETAIEGEAKN